LLVELEDERYMRCHLCHFNIWTKWFLSEYAAKLLSCPPCFLLVHLLIPFGPLSQPQYNFLAWYLRAAEKCINCVTHKSVLSVHSNLSECRFLILKLYWRLFFTDFFNTVILKKSPVSIFSNMFSLNRWRMANVHLRNLNLI